MIDQQKQQKITACAFLHKDGKLLTAKRAMTKSFLPGVYELVGGHVEFGETLEECLVREFHEELHIDIVVGNIFYAFTYLEDDGIKHVVEVEFFAKMQDESQAIVLNPEDHSEYHWVTKEEVDKYNFTEEEKKAIVRGFELLALQ